MKLYTRKMILAAPLLAALLTVGYGSLLTIHAKSPHKCIRPGLQHAQQHICGHSDNPDFQHGLGEVSPAQARGEQHGMELGAIPNGKHDSKTDEATLDWTDPCICPVRCFLSGALSNQPWAEALGKVRKYGLFAE